MNCNEFNALNRGLRSIRETKNPGAKSGAGTDASAFHGRPGARVALLQSPILPAAITFYRKKRIVRGLPIDKPHTRVSRLTILPFDLPLRRHPLGCGSSDKKSFRTNHSPQK